MGFVVWFWGSGGAWAEPAVKPFQSFAASASGQVFATASADGEVRLWDFSTGSVIGTWSLSHADIRALAFLPGDQILVGAGADKFYIFDAADRSMADFSATKGMIRCLTPWNGGVLAAGDDLTVQFIAKDSRGTWAIRQSWSTTHRGYIKALLVGPDGQKVVTGADDGKVEIHELPLGTLVRSWTAGSDWIRSVQSSPDGKNLFTLSDDRKLKKWRWDGSLAAELSLSPGTPRCLAFTEDLFLCGLNDGSLVVGRVTDLKILSVTPAHQSALVGLMAVPSGWLSAAAEPSLTLWKPAVHSGKPVKLFSQHW